MAFKAKENDVVVIFIGLSGSGKSRFIKCLSGKGKNTVAAFFLGAQTKKIIPYRMQRPGGSDLVLVDTPGYNVEELLKEKLDVWLLKHYGRRMDTADSEKAIRIVVFQDILQPKIADNPDNLLYLGIKANRPLFVTSRWNQPGDVAKRQKRETMYTEEWKKIYSNNHKIAVQRFRNTPASAQEVATGFGWIS